MKTYEFEVNFHANVCVSIGGHINDWKKFLRERYGGRIPPLWYWDKGEQKRQYVKDIRNTDGYSVWVDYEQDKHDEVFYMWIEDINRHLLHEILHITGYIMFVRGFKYEDAEENWAYMIQEIADKLKDIINANKSTI